MRVDGKANRQTGSFEVTGMGPGTFVEAVRRTVATMDLAVRISVSLDGEQLVVAVERLGRSVLRYDLTPHGDGFTARLRARRVAPLHLPFSHDYQETAARILGRVAGEGSARPETGPT